jgi:hypothetical protein
MIFHCARPTRGVRDRALREHRRSSGSIPPLIPPSSLAFSHRRVACLASHCARRTSTFLSCAFREHRRLTGYPPILPLTDPLPPVYDSPHLIRP